MFYELLLEPGEERSDDRLALRRAQRELRLALELARRAYRRWLDSFLYLWRRHNLDPILAAYPDEIDGLIAEDRALVGSPATVRAGLQRQADDPSSQLRQRIATEIQVIGRRVADDSELQSKIDSWVESVVMYLLDEHRHQAGDLIASTVERWNPEDASRRVELAVGRDLQFIRINGTVVGGLAGVVIYAIGRLIA